MKKALFLAAVAALSTGFYTNAQEVKQAAQPVKVAPRSMRQVDPSKVAEMRVNRLSKDVPELSETQKKQAYDVYLKSAQNRPEYKADAREKMADVRKNEEAEIIGILNPDQAAKYKEMQVQRETARKQAMEQRLKTKSVDNGSQPVRIEAAPVKE